MGTWQAQEAVKIILGVGEVADDKLLLFNGLTGEYRSLRRKRDKQCAVCGDHPAITVLTDLELYCSPVGQSAAEAELELNLEAVPGNTGPVWKDFDALELMPDDVAAFVGSRDVQWIDVREPYEYDRYHIPGSMLLPMSQMNTRFREIDPHRPVIVVCAIGQRSLRVTHALRKAGHKRAHNLKGGMVYWINARLPIESSSQRSHG
jgi:adenylyltransferase/sulfurtransferase